MASSTGSRTEENQTDEMPFVCRNKRRRALNGSEELEKSTETGIGEIERESVEMFCKHRHPLFKLVCTNTRRDILLGFKNEKQHVYDYIDALECKVSLSVDIWDGQVPDRSYLCVTCHFLDEEWSLKSKIIGYKKIERIDSPYGCGDRLFWTLRDLCIEWNIDRKLVSITVDNGSEVVEMVELFKTWLEDNSIFTMDGLMFRVPCSGYNWNLVVQEGLQGINALIEKIRHTVKYLDVSPDAKEKFYTAASHVKLRWGERVKLDEPNKWNSTYLMLDSALKMKEAFDRLELLDKNFTDNPSKQEWLVAKDVCACLKKIYDATENLSRAEFLTSNLLFANVCEIHLLLNEMHNSDKFHLRSMAIQMKKQFLKYWNDCSLFLAVAVALDPRFKLHFVEYYFKKLSDLNLATASLYRVRGALFGLFDEYKKQSTVPLVNDGTSSDSDDDSNGTKFADFEKWYAQKGCTDAARLQKSELEQYLEEPIFPVSEPFDILLWWKVNKARFPILGKIARDILAVPVTTMASGSFFRIGEGLIVESKSKLNSGVIEALVCYNNWTESFQKEMFLDVSVSFVEEWKDD